VERQVVDAHNIEGPLPSGLESPPWKQSSLRTKSFDASVVDKNNDHKILFKYEPNTQMQPKDILTK
jgi:hypothetical protein